jgi:hypothetical protein
VSDPVSDSDRERTAELLQKACGDGRLTLEEFSVRVGAAWAAETSTELQVATAGLALLPVVGAAQPVDRVVTVFSESKRKGRWRLRGQALRTLTVFGTLELDLREVLTDADTIEVTGSCWFGEVKIIVPEGVEVDLIGRALFASREVHLAPVPRVPGTPLVRLDLSVNFGSVSVRSQPPQQLGR